MACLVQSPDLAHIARLAASIRSASAVYPACLPAVSPGLAAAEESAGVSEVLRVVPGVLAERPGMPGLFVPADGTACSDVPGLLRRGLPSSALTASLLCLPELSLTSSLVAVLASELVPVSLREMELQAVLDAGRFSGRVLAGYIAACRP